MSVVVVLDDWEPRIVPSGTLPRVLIAATKRDNTLVRHKNVPGEIWTSTIVSANVVNHAAVVHTKTGSAYKLGAASSAFIVENPAVDVTTAAQKVAVIKRLL
jgi:hypothetical protein